MKTNPYQLTRIAAALLALSAISTGALAALTDISDQPIASTGTVAAKPNILFILDDSGSMDDTVLPDGLETTGYCYGYSGYNHIFYDPNTTYAVPVTSTGANLNASSPTSFTRAYVNGYDTTAGTVDLSNTANLPTTPNQVLDNPSCTRRCTYHTGPAFYYATDNGSAANVCDDDSKYTPVTSLSTAAQKLNYANWYSYYRKRIYFARAAASFAFQPLDNKFRVGFTTIHANDPTDFLNVADFDSTQKSTFYSTMFSTAPGSSTPLRGALSIAGRYYAKKLANQTYDPMQYACQKNFTILSTDGYWNTADETGARRGYKLDGTNWVGNQDSGLDVPYNDKLNARDTTGVSNSLADIAAYYYNTDLRTSAQGNCTGSVTGVSVCSDSRDTKYDTQRMYTYTIGLGLNGNLTYVDGYDTPAQGDYLKILQGTKFWGDPISNTTYARIDDLWHAAVNGHGHYYSANNANELATSLNDALAKINAQTGSSSAAATSNLEPVQGDNFAYVASYRTQEWYGDVLSSTVDPTTGAVALTNDANGFPIPGTYVWSAQAQLDPLAGDGTDSRTIYFFDSTQTSKLNSFTYANLDATKKAYFSNVCVSPYKLTQCTGMSSANQTIANSGDNMVKYLRGQYSYEGGVAGKDELYRPRTHRLGDIVNASPAFAGKPKLPYGDTGYSDYITAQASRAGTVYAAANDGMLHAFNASNGNERWAYIPTAVMPNLYKLAATDYPSNHQYFVDGSPVVGDVYFGSAWHTILVGGLGKGGRSYYALDITDPTAPKALWEFSDTNLGYSYGNPVIAKLRDGTWVVMVSGGYNNADGNGHLFIVNAATGAKVTGGDIQTYTSGSTPAGTSGSPSGMVKIEAWVDSQTDNTAQRVYGGDLLGNVWRFDINDIIAPSGKEAMLLANLSISSTPQPITTRPRVAKGTYGGSDYNFVMVATGKYMGQSDLTSTAQQSVYGIKDTLGSTSLGNFRSRSDVVSQTLTNATIGGKSVLTVTQNPVDWSSKMGWYFDFLATGERSNIEMQQQFNILSVIGNVPGSSTCVAGGGYANKYFVDIMTGSSLSTSDNNIIGTRLDTDSLIAGQTLVKVGDKLVNITTCTTGCVKAESVPAIPAAAGDSRRISWRELVN
ncbi:type IV pilus assembly protein PilY1 [Andreprevotia lacus DSM 23236]|uniref:Type IV pilus assembly protein PilY1 n=1 Tax=Andreprevotia lacus DSM 23236 TaxID=1121001 RepID=A0A1W1XBA8_9NEIS|nr:PilC/PilY family type IV pilus protein [Andreprevotia lacus]SMC21133.1 type IV pilus assembly protein PilY1 [Andreprevotia lacus DSM 23236]